MIDRDITLTGGARNSDPGTSHDAAAQDFTAVAKIIHGKIDDAGEEGATWSELEISTGIARQTISPRFVQLRRLDLIRNSGRKRKAPSGRFQIVWVATTPEEMKRIRAQEAPVEKKLRKEIEALIRAGNQCSNCCYNLGQQVGVKIDPSLAVSMSESAKAWDAAKTEFFQL